MRKPFLISFFVCQGEKWRIIYWLWGAQARILLHFRNDFFSFAELISFYVIYYLKGNSPLSFDGQQFSFHFIWWTAIREPAPTTSTAMVISFPKINLVSKTFKSLNMGVSFRRVSSVVTLAWKRSRFSRISFLYTLIYNEKNRVQKGAVAQW